MCLGTVAMGVKDEHRKWKKSQAYFKGSLSFLLICLYAILLLLTSQSYKCVDYT